MGTLRALPYTECVRRLDEGNVGRVAVTDRALPAIVPINYVRAGALLIFRTEADGMLARACNGAVVAFEIDGLDADGRAGWSVLVVGQAELLDPGSALAVVETSLHTAAGPGREQFVGVVIGTVTGREVVRDEAA